MRIQRKSEAFRRGITNSETKYAQYLQKQGLNYVTQEVICLWCGNHTKSIGIRCDKCGNDLIGKDKFAVVDFLIGAWRIVEIDGSIHDTFKGEERDRIRDRKLSMLGYKVFHIRNEELDKLCKC